MSDTPALPPRPDLNWLKNRAKDALAELRAADPAAKLSAAQRIVARRYGFASWRALKAHIDALDQDGEAVAVGENDLATTAEAVKTFADALRGDVAVVRKMLDEHPMLASATFDGFPILHHAAGEGQPAMIRLLIERGADPNQRGARSLHTPLSWAVTNDRLEICKALIDGGAKVDLWCAAGMGWIVNVRGFFDERGNVRPGASFTGSSRYRADGSRIVEISSDPIDVISDALYIACRNGRSEVAEYLLERGADPNFRAYMGATCFHWAYFGGGEPRLVAAMLDHGGDASAVDADRRCTPRAFGVLVTAGWGWASKLKRILDNDASLANLFEAGSTPLHEAARHGHAEAVQLLLSRGAERDRLDADGKTARDRAAEANHVAVVELLKA